MELGSRNRNPIRSSRLGVCSAGFDTCAFCGDPEPKPVVFLDPRRKFWREERARAQVLRWERRHVGECCCPRLRKFEGKPTQFSPKARLLNLLGYKLPFDRHDWIVDRCGRDVRCAPFSHPPPPIRWSSPHFIEYLYLDINHICVIVIHTSYASY